MTETTNYPANVFFDIETLINVAQPSSILFIGEQSTNFLQSYVEQKELLNQHCKITHIHSDELDTLSELERHDVAIAIDVFEHIDKQTGFQLLSRLRDLLTHQYCISLPINEVNLSANSDDWQLTELFGFALERVATYDLLDERHENDNHKQITLFKYNINDYKKTPDWLNSDNWANPEIWGKYRW